MASAGCKYALQVSCASHKAPLIRRHRFDRRPKACLSSDHVKAAGLRNLAQLIPISLRNVQKSIKESSLRLLDAFVDHAFEFVDQPYLPSQGNFAPVDEIEEAVRVTTTHGRIPDHDFPKGVYVRNGANPNRGALKSAESIFGKSSHIWVEGEGMIHALYFTKDDDNKWITFYNNKYVKTDTFQMEKQRKKPVFLPAAEGDPVAILLALLVNSLRVGKISKNMSNTSVFEHAGKYYSSAENDVPQEIDILTLETIGNWDNIITDWNNRPFTSHPKKSAETGELIIHGSDGKKPYLELGVISADGTKLIHKVDFQFERSIICHEIGITQRYNVIMDFPLTIDENRLLSGGPLIKFEKESFARIGVMPRYGNADSVRWFGVETCCTFHIINCYEENDEVVVMACRAEDSVIPGPELGIDKFEWFSRGFKHLNSIQHNENNNLKEGFLFARPYMWRLNLKTGQVKENYLTGTDFSMDFPMINDKFTGLKNKYAYTQVVDCDASSAAGMAKYSGLAKLYLQERNINFSDVKNNLQDKENIENFRRTEYHMFPENTFCTGSTFVPKNGSAVEEDDGWLITFVHNEKINLSEVFIVDAKNFSSEPVARITIPCRVPYGFHGSFMPISSL